MTIRQKRLLKNLGKARSVKEAALMSGYSKSVARSQQAELVKGLNIQQELAKRDKKAFARYDESFDANKIIVSPTEPDREFPDHRIRLDAVKTHFQVRGWLKDNPEINNTNNVMIVESYGAKDPLTNRTATLHEANTGGSQEIEGIELAQEGS